MGFMNNVLYNAESFRLLLYMSQTERHYSDVLYYYACLISKFFNLFADIHVVVFWWPAFRCFNALEGD